MIANAMLTVVAIHMMCFILLICYMTNHRFREKRRRKRQQPKTTKEKSKSVF